jgi:hypothetical protein
MQRILTFDLARGIMVFLFPSVHVLMLYGNREVQQSLPGYILVFIAECTGAQLSMLLMGILFSFSKRPRLKRGLHLIVLGYALNFCTCILLLGLNLLPDQFLHDHGQYDKSASISFFLFAGNIFHFAGIAWIILYFIFHLRYYPYRALYFSVAILFLSPMFWDIHTSISLFDYFFTLMGGHPPDIYFPLIPWLIFPLTGLTLGYFIKKKPTTIAVVGWVGCALILISFIFPSTIDNNEWLAFYRTKLPDTIFHLGFVFLWLALFRWINSKIPFNRLFQFFTFCSRNITVIFVIQEILIAGCLPLAGYQTNPLQSTLCWMAALTVITILITFLIKQSEAKSRKLI